MKKYNWFGKIMLAAVIAALVLTGTGNMKEVKAAGGNWCEGLGNNPNNLKIVREKSDSPVVTDGEHLYFIERSELDYELIYRLVQTGLDGSEKKYLAEANGGLNYLDGYLYYYVLEGKTARIERIDLASMTTEVLAELQGGDVTTLLVTEDYVFFYLTHNAFGSVQAIDQKSGEIIYLGGDNWEWGLPLTVVNGTLYSFGATRDEDHCRNVYAIPLDAIGSGAQLEQIVEKKKYPTDNSFLFVEDGVYCIRSEGMEYHYFHDTFDQISEEKWDTSNSEKLTDADMDYDLAQLVVSNHFHFLLGNDLYLAVPSYDNERGHFVRVHRFPGFDLMNGEVIAEFTGIMTSAGTDLAGEHLYIILKDNNERETLISRIAVVNADGTYVENPITLAEEQYTVESVYVRSVEDDTAYDYDLYTDHVVLTRYHGAESELTVPTEIDGLPVTEIGDDTYYNKQELTKVTIPEGITSIGVNAFGDCRNLKEVILPESLTTIKLKAFYRCKLLDTINLTENIIEIEKEAFRNTGLTEITIPSSLKTISESLFRECSNLTGVTIPEGVETIENYAFYECKLPTVRIPDSVTSIGKDPFSAGYLKTITGSANSMAKEISERKDYKQRNVEYVEE
ncbi:MAG: leucine-rich repeat protein [Parasporobacterium sp.]|nr:leucine-rich repeat protein [Parasporobacterium sp.]